MVTVNEKFPSLTLSSGINLAVFAAKNQLSYINLLYFRPGEGSGNSVLQEKMPLAVNSHSSRQAFITVKRYIRVSPVSFTK